MNLTNEQQKVVETNMGLVGKVIKDKVHGAGQVGYYTYEDLFQIGCIGLCKAAATDKGGCFSTYAYRLIWNEICDALIYATKRQTTELLSEDGNIYGADEAADFDPVIDLDLFSYLQEIKSGANETVCKGIDVLILRAKGYTGKEICEKMGARSNLISAWVAKAKKALSKYAELRELYESSI